MKLKEFIQLSPTKFTVRMSTLAHPWLSSLHSVSGVVSWFEWTQLKMCNVSFLHFRLPY